MEVWMIYFFSDQTFRLKYNHPNLFSGAIFAGNSNLQKWEHRHRHVASWCFASDRFTKNNHCTNTHSTSNPAQSQLWFDTRVLDAPFWNNLYQIGQAYQSRDLIMSDHVKFLTALQSDDAYWSFIKIEQQTHSEFQGENELPVTVS